MTGKLAHLNELVKLDNRVTLSWVPGHEGHMENEVADWLAKRGADQTVQGPAPWVPAANCIQKRLLNNWRDVRCEEKWKNREDCRQSKLVLPNIKNKWSKMILSKPKSQIKVMVQLVTGHANLRRHRFLMKLEDSPQCECGEDEETSIHLLTSCPLQARNRWHYLGKATLRAEEIQNININKIIRFARSTNKWTSDL